MCTESRFRGSIKEVVERLLDYRAKYELGQIIAKT